MEISFGSTPAGNIDIELYDDQAPKTVVNFLHYAGRGDYNNSLIHRSVNGFIVQGGGHSYFPNLFSNPPGQPSFFKIPADPPIQNEFSLSRSNVRGTIAMAKVGGNPNSATSEWFFNLSDSNAANLDNQNGGFTVFGCVLDTGSGTCAGTGSGMNVIDTIAALPTFDGANKYPFYLRCNPDPNTMLCRNPEYFRNLPTIGYDSTAYIDGDPTTYLNGSNAIYVSRIPNVASTSTNLGTIPTFTSDVDMVFASAGTATTDYAKKILASFSSPPNQSVYFNNGIHKFTMTGTMGTVEHVVKLYDGATTRPTHYYAYGKTPDNQTDHWYDFSYDGETGAKIEGDKILLYFMDGKRGDEDLDPTNNSITHTGAQAVVTSIASTGAQSGGCSIATNPSRTWRGGDWVLVSLFLVVLGIVRRRARRQV